MFIRNKGNLNKKNDEVYIFSQTKDNYESLRENLNLYNINSHCSHLKQNEIENDSLRHDDNKTIYIIDEDSYDDETINYLARALKKKKKILIGKNNSLNKLWKAKNVGYDEYFSLNSDCSILVTIILNMLGNVKKNKCLITSVLNTSFNSDLSYRLLDDITKCKTLSNRRSLLINYDFFNVYYDFKLNLKPDDQAKEYFLNGDFGELDYLSANKMIVKITNNLDYFSLNLLSCKSGDLSEILDKIERFTNVISENYDIIIITYPTYISAKEQSINMISQSDIVVFMTNSTVESIYNLKRIDEQLPAHREGAFKLHRIEILNENYNYEQRLTIDEIEEIFGIENIINLGGVRNRFFRKNINIVDYIFKPKN